MGVPENAGSSGPVRKRQRLSLKTTKKKTDAKADQKVSPVKGKEDGGQNFVSDSESGGSLSTTSLTSNATSYITSGSTSCSWTGSETTVMSSSTESTVSSITEMKVPAIASLENLGNTCFMNSIMQVLRYTPGFLENLVRVYQHIQMNEKIKKKMKASDELQESEREAEDQKNCWNVVKSVFKVYKDQSLLEEAHEEIASDDGMSMAVKPIKILQAVRTLNPMFEGTMQHDAQEFLKCFLAYMQDAEKEIRKFSLQIPKDLPLKAVVNPVMQRFLQSAKSKGDKQELSSQNVVVKVENSEPIDKKEHMDVTDSVPVDKAKVNLFSKLQSAGKIRNNNDTLSVVSEPHKPTRESPIKNGDKITPRIAKTAENIIGKGLDDYNLLQTASMEAAVLSEGNPATTEIKGRLRTDQLKNRKLMKGHSKKTREYSPYKNAKETRKSNKVLPVKIEEKTDENNMDEILEREKKLNKIMQPSLTDMYGKTYSRNKRLGMSRSVTKQSSAENLFDAMRGLDKSNTIKQGDSCTRGLNSPLESNDKTQTTTGLKNGQNSKETVENPEISKQEPGSISSESSYLSVYTHFLSAVSSSVDDAVESVTSSDEDEKILIMEKKRAKIIHESPRRSPRKANSQPLISTPTVINKLDFSKSETDLKSVRLNTDTALNSVSATNLRNQHDTDKQSALSTNEDRQTDSSANANTLASTSNISDTDFPMVNNTTSPDRIKVDCDISFKKQAVKQHVDSKIALEPVIQLENCDHVFKNNETSVSASFATKCLSPFKRASALDCSSGNYLKQRNLVEPTVDTEEMEKALEAMFNSPAKSNSKCDFIEQLFQGTMMLRTQCLLCETCIEREEEFHDISVPVRLERNDSDDEDDKKDCSKEDKRCSLLDMIEASTEPEKLQNDNKYYCSECLSYKEAEHSVHYDVLPDILTLHLKRFSACSSNFGYTSKINDAVDIPMSLPCLRYRCPQSCLRPDHKYKLYGIITHTGVTLSSGHYLAYVRAPPLPDDAAPTTNHSMLSGPINDSQNSAVDTDIKSENVATTRGKSGIALKLPSRFDKNIVTNTKVKAFANVAGKGKKDLIDSLKTNRDFAAKWFECDDESIRVFEESEFADLLTKSQGSLLGTPYLLFYHKSTIC